MSVLSPSNFPSIRKWILSHQRASQYIRFDDISGDKVLMSSKNVSLMKYVKQLQGFMSFLEKEKSKVIEKIRIIAEEPIMTLGNLCYDNNSEILLLRKMVYIHRQIQQDTLSLSNEKHIMYIEKIEDVESFLELLTSSIIPPNFHCKINENFFILSIPSRFTEMEYKLECYSSCYNSLSNQVSQIVKPLWVTDFKSFLKEVLSNSIHHYDEELAYVPPLSCELSISRYVFGGISTLGNQIDSLIDSVFDEPPQEFIRNVLDLCVMFIPQDTDLSTEEQSIALIVFFRIVFDRLYESHSSFMMPNPGNEIKMIQLMSTYPATCFKLPKDVSPVFENSDTIREAFRKDYYFMIASQFLELSAYSTNPLDVLFSVHNTLISINKAALIRRLKGTEASVNDIQQLLCFDDLFVLLLGVYFGADLPEIYTISDLVTRFVPSFCLSNPFEYAQAGLEALVSHLSSLNSKNNPINPK